jgi:hypothetical protein
MLAKKLMGEIKFVASQQIMCQQKPARQSFVQSMNSIAGGRLGNLSKDRMNIPQ